MTRFDDARTPQMLTTPQQAEQLYIYLHPLLYVCAVGISEGPWDSETPGFDPWNRLVLRSLDHQHLREALALRLQRLAHRFPQRVAVTTSVNPFI